MKVVPERGNYSMLLDKNVNLQCCRKYFTSDGWLAVQNLVEAIKKDPVWYCGRCTNPINDLEENSIQCGSCLIWYHFECTNLKNPPKNDIGFVIHESFSNWYRHAKVCFDQQLQQAPPT